MLRTKYCMFCNRKAVYWNQNATFVIDGEQALVKAGTCFKHSGKKVSEKQVYNSEFMGELLYEEE